WASTTAVFLCYFPTHPPTTTPTLFPYTTLFRSHLLGEERRHQRRDGHRQDRQRGAQRRRVRRRGRCLVPDEHRRQAPPHGRGAALRASRADPRLDPRRSLRPGRDDPGEGVMTTSCRRTARNEREETAS